MGQLHSYDHDKSRRRTFFNFYKQHKNQDLNEVIQSLEDTFRPTQRQTLLLLGSSSSGKTTILNQLRINYGPHFDQDEREHFKKIIYRNVIDGMIWLCMGAQELEISNEILPFQSPQFNLNVLMYEENEPDGNEFKEYLQIVQYLWNDPVIREVWNRRFELKEQFGGCLDYFFNALSRISSPDYIATDEDIVHCRFKTTGIFEINCNIKEIIFSVLDVAGARNERRKWAHCRYFNLILYVVSLGDFDEFLFEDNSVNRMVDSFDLFKYIATTEQFMDSRIILILNKCDLLREKIQIHDISAMVEFSDFSGQPNSFEDVSQYFFQKFYQVCPERIISHFFFTGIDRTEHFDQFFESCERFALQGLHIQS